MFNSDQLRNLGLTNMRSNSGFTLIELLIGITMGMVVLGGILAVYIPTLQTFKASSSHTNLQDIEQISHSIFAGKISRSSMLVCGSNEWLNNGVSALPSPTLQWAFNFSQPFLAFSSTDTAIINSTFNSNGSSTGNLSRKRLRQNGKRAHDDNASNAVGDVFYTLAPDGLFARIVDVDNSNFERNIGLKNVPQIKQGDLFLIHDCRFPVVLRAIKNRASQIIHTSTFQTTYDFGISKGVQAVVSGYEPTVYYLGSLDGKPALYTRTIKAKLVGGLLAHNDNPILTGIVNMRLEYGVDTMNPQKPEMVSKYFTVSELKQQSDDIKNAQALSVRIILMLQADQSVGDHLQEKLIFPTIDGVEVDCLKASMIANYDTACPAFIDFEKKLHKVVRFTFSLSQQTVI